MPSPIVFVCGATGTQGGATARQLLHSGATVHALARDPSSPKAKALEALGVKLWPGDFDNEAALRKATEGAEAVFMNYMPDFTDMGHNLRQAQLLMRIAAEQGTVKQVVYSSGVALDKMLQSPLVDPNSLLYALLKSKVDIEEAVQNSGLPSWTILRPANFMANYVNPLAKRQVSGLASTGRWTTANLRDGLMPLVDSHTIGRFSAAALLDPERFGGKVVTYADEFLSMGDVVRKLAEVTGRDLQMVSMSEEEVEARKAVDPFVAGQLAMGEMYKYVDLDEVRSWGIPLTSFDQFLEREKEAVEATYLNAQ